MSDDAQQQKTPESSQKPLASFLREINSTTVQTRKFLATAVWLQDKGRNRLETGDVAQALKDSNQSRLGNASDCLNQNVNKGYCEKNGKSFYVTEEGRSEIVGKKMIQPSQALSAIPDGLRNPLN